MFMKPHVPILKIYRHHKHTAVAKLDPSLQDAQQKQTFCNWFKFLLPTRRSNGVTTCWGVRAGLGGGVPEGTRCETERRRCLWMHVRVDTDGSCDASPMADWLRCRCDHVPDTSAITLGHHLLRFPVTDLLSLHRQITGWYRCRHNLTSCFPKACRSGVTPSFPHPPPLLCTRGVANLNLVESSGRAGQFWRHVYLHVELMLLLAHNEIGVVFYFTTS